jgi:hypothetical protein
MTKVNGGARVRAKIARPRPATTAFDTPNAPRHIAA